MGYEKTGIFGRYLVQPRRSITLSADISAGAFVATVPLMTLSHNGDRNGDSWSRTIYSQAEQFPWFLVKDNGSNSVLSTHFKLSASRSIQFEGSATALNVAVSLARELAPQGTLVTSLTENSAKTRAQALDSTISNLFALNIAEQHSSDSDIRRWHSGDRIELWVSIPSEDDALNGMIHPIGRWIVELDDPRPSIFADVRVCQATEEQNTVCQKDVQDAIDRIVHSVKAADVLSFSIIPLAPPNTALGTIATYITQHDGFATAVTAISASKTKDLTTSTQLCRNIRDWTSSLGFSSLDQDIILWAIATALPAIPPSSGQQILSACKNAVLSTLMKLSFSN